MRKCPACGKLNDDDWPLKVDGKIIDGGCTDCWEAQSDAMWWACMTAIDSAIHETKEENNV